MSAYDNDSRVVLHDDGSATIPAPEGDSNEGDLKVKHATHGGFTAQRVGGDNDGYYITNKDYGYVLDSVDDWCAYVLGDPQ